MKTLISITLTFAIALSAFAQKKELTLDDVVSGGSNFYSFYPEYKNYTFQTPSNKLALIEYNVIYNINNKLEKQELIKLSDVNNALKASGLENTSSIAGIKWFNENSVWFKNKSNFILYNIIEKKVIYNIPFPEDCKVTDFNPQAEALIYVHNDNLYIRKRDGKETLIAKGSKNGIVLGQSVHRNEFGIKNGIFWSPKGNKVAFYRKDETMVTDYPIVNVEERVAKLENIKYPMAGMKSHHVTVGVYNINSNEKPVFLKTNKPKEEFMTNIGWSPDEKYITVAELNRGQNHMDFGIYNSSTGEKIKVLFSEDSKEWVEPENPPVFIPGSNTNFIWQSEKDGYNHLYLYDINKGLKKQITKGKWVVTDINGFDAKGKNIFITSTKDGVLYRNLYKVNIKSGKITRLTKKQGYHYIKLSADATKAIDIYSNLNTPRVIDLIDLPKHKTYNLLTAKNPYKDYDIGNISIDTIKSADGVTDLYCRTILPPNFDSNKKYPVILYVYGGPHAQLVTGRFLGGITKWHLYLAQKGYIVFTLDNRGTPYRGCKFEKVIHRKLGEDAAADQMEGIKYLLKKPYVDKNRIGVDGWSFGGFMTINLMEKHPDIFKVGVAGGPVIDWKYYEVMYGERYMDTPKENPEGYEKCNLNLRAKDIKGRLLIIHGAIDPTVVWQNSLTFLTECVENNVQVDYFVYPRHEHNVRGIDRVHLIEKIIRYFDDFLK